MKYTIYLIFFLLIGCDIPSKIIIINKSGNAAMYRYTIADPPRDIKVIDLNKDNSKATILFGFGQFWTDQRIKEYAKSLKRVDIITNTDTVTLIGQDVIAKFFKDRRSGIFNETVKITID